MLFRERCLRPFGSGTTTASYYALDALREQGLPDPARLPVCLRIILESLLRRCDGQRVTEQHVHDLLAWEPDGQRDADIPFMVGRVVLQDVAGIPLLCDLAAMRSAMARAGRPVSAVRPRIPVDMVIDHSLEVDFHARPDALVLNSRLEMQRNEERFLFVKWAMQAIEGIRLIPSGFGILHQVNLEFLARGLLREDGVVFPDTLVGTDSHSCMISALGVVGWGVGGIEAESAMLGEPVSFLSPDVVAVELRGRLRAGVTSTDLVLHVTRLLRQAKVVGQFLEFIGEGVAGLSVPDRASIANMAPEYGATLAFFPFDEQSVRYLNETGRDPQQVRDAQHYFELQGCFGAAGSASARYTRRIEIDLSEVSVAIAGPRRPQDLVALDVVKPHIRDVMAKPVREGGFGRSAASWRPAPAAGATPPRYEPHDADVLVAAITSCTNTSNPSVMLMAGLVAQAAVRKGLRHKPWVKTSMAPGSLVVSRYLQAAGLHEPLEALGFGVVGYGCTTCIGNSGPLADGVQDALAASGAIGCAVLSGNRNFEARIHPALRANYLASPPLVVAYALAGTMDIDWAHEPLGLDAGGKPVFLADLWPQPDAVTAAVAHAAQPAQYHAVYQDELALGNPLWHALPTPKGELYAWDARSSYIQEPPFFRDPGLMRSALADIVQARALLILGDSVTTDHISPIGTIAPDSAAGRYLSRLGVPPGKAGSYGTRRMNHEVMVRGGFGNIQLRNRMLDGVEGAWTRHQPSGEQLSIFDAAERYGTTGTPLIVFAGEEYGTGSARDWAAKATRLLGVRAVVAGSFERIHRSNLAGMGVLPCQLPEGVTATTLGLDGTEVFAISGLSGAVKPGQPLTLSIRRRNGEQLEVPLRLRLDTLVEIEYATRGGLLPYILDRCA